MRVDIPEFAPMRAAHPMWRKMLMGVWDECGDLIPVEWDETFGEYVRTEIFRVRHHIEMPDDATSQEIKAAVHDYMEGVEAFK